MYMKTRIAFLHLCVNISRLYGDDIFMRAHGSFGDFDACVIGHHPST